MTNEQSYAGLLERLVARRGLFAAAEKMARIMGCRFTLNELGKQKAEEARGQGELINPDGPEAVEAISSLLKALEIASKEVVELTCDATEKLRDLGCDCDPPECTYIPILTRIDAAKLPVEPVMLTNEGKVYGWETLIDDKAADTIAALYEALVEARLSVDAEVEETSDPDAKYHSFNHVFVERLAKIDAALSLALGESPNA